jgi:hypothetical protein
MDVHEVINNKEQMQFQIPVDGYTALLEYRFYKEALALMHTEVPEPLEGKGLASELSHYAFEWAKNNNKKVRVYCSFAKTYLEKHPEYQTLVDK